MCVHRTRSSQSALRSPRNGYLSAGNHPSLAVATVALPVLLSMLFPASTPAGVNKWTTNGPEGESVYSLAIDPSVPTTLYSGTALHGVFKSVDGGQSWTPVNAGLPINPNAAVNALAIDPSAPATLYAGTSTDGVFRSTDGGQSWTPVNVGLTDRSIQALAIHPSAPATLYAGSLFGGIFKSTNGGESWMAASAGLAITDVDVLAIDPSTPATIYAGGGGGIFKSTSG